MPPTSIKGALIQRLADLLGVKYEKARFLDKLNNKELPLLYDMIDKAMDEAASVGSRKPK